MSSCHILVLQFISKRFSLSYVLKMTIRHIHTFLSIPQKVLILLSFNNPINFARYVLHSISFYKTTDWNKIFFEWHFVKWHCRIPTHEVRHSGHLNVKSLSDVIVCLSLWGYYLFSEFSQLETSWNCRVDDEDRDCYFHPQGLLCCTQVINYNY